MGLKEIVSRRSEKAVFTIVSRNYLHFARTVMVSLACQHPDWDRYVLLVDRNEGDFDSEHENFEVVEVDALPLPERRRFYFRYTVLELNTAVKPWMIEWLFAEKGYRQVVYLDPDIFVYRPMHEVEALLDGGAMMVVTPHLTGRLADDKRPTELDIMRAGSFNLGFIALAQHSELVPFLRWWQSKLEFDCVVNFEAGLFVDQRWIDLAPGMFGGVAILRHEGYNVAYWNLLHRRVRRAADGYYVNGDPLVFFHYSGFNPLQPESFSKHQNRFILKTLGDARALVEAYGKAVVANGLEHCVRLPYAFSVFADGSQVTDLLRRLYRQNVKLQRLGGADPFAKSDMFNLPCDDEADNVSPTLSVVMKSIWDSRTDLQTVFPAPGGQDRVRFARWYVQNAEKVYRLPTVLVEPTRQQLAICAESMSSACSDATALVLERTAGFVYDAYRVILQRDPDRQGLAHYQRLLAAGVGEDEIIDRLLYSRESLRRRVGSISRMFKRMVTSRRDGYGSHRTVANVSAASTDAVSLPRVEKRGCPKVDDDWDLPFGMDYAGFYAPEKKAAWMGVSAKIRLPTYRSGGSLRIIGDYEPQLHARANGSGVTPVDVALNGEKAGRFELERQGAFDVTVLLQHSLECGSVIVELRPAQYFVPAQIGINDDSRRLSLRIAQVWFDDQLVLDFADPARTASRWEQQIPPAVNIIGYVRSEHGLGQSSRQFALATEAAAIPFTMYDFNVGNASRTEDSSWSHRLNSDNPHPVNVFHINADQMPVVYDALGRGFFRGHYNVGFWHWELPELPNEYLAGFSALQEVWVPTAFVLDAVSAKAPVPVVKMPHAIQFAIDYSVNRAQAGLPEGKFLFLTMYDLHSYHERKNPEAVIAAFRKAFPVSADVMLVVKVQNTASCPEDFVRLQEIAATSGNIVLIDKTLQRQDVYNLEWLCDCFVSLHRSEGFGLGLAESMYLGKPVVATNWSGNVEFMHSGNSFPVDYRLIQIERDVGVYKRGQLWADPDIDHAAWLMTKLVSDDELRRYIAWQGQQTILNDFSPTAIGARIRRRLQFIERMLHS